ncbi:MAG: winged helix-turn-helix transcriptional regulator [Candidatus Thorarchaeota archaeon]
MLPTEEENKSFKKRLIETIREYPGLSLRDLSRELKSSASLVKYHVDDLIVNNKVVTLKDGKAIRFFHVDHNISQQDIRIFKIIRNPVILEIIIFFLESRSSVENENQRYFLRNTDIFKRLEFNSKGTISYYLKRLVNEKIIRKDEGFGYELIDPEKMRTILRNYKPNPSIISNFASLWMNFYKESKNDSDS